MKLRAIPVCSQRPNSSAGCSLLLRAWALAAAFCGGLYPSSANADDLGDTSAMLFAPYAEWEVRNSTTSGNPYDVVASVTFSHEASGEERSTEMFFAGDDTWKFRFSGTQLGAWTFTTTSDDPELSGHTGRITVTDNPDGNRTGFLIAVDNQYAVQVAPGEARGYLLNIYMSEGRFPTATSASDFLDTTRNRFDDYLDEVELNGFNVVFLHPARPETWTDSGNPRRDVFQAIENAIVSAHARGLRVHLWAWGDAARGWVPPNGINSREDRRLQRYIAARLGPIAGWTMGYGFDLHEWVSEAQTQSWAEFMHERMGWAHLLWARDRSNAGLDVVSYPSFNVRDYDRVVRDLQSDPQRPHLYEERHTYRRNGDLDMDGTRGFLWNLAMAGGMGGFWGFFARGGDEGPPYPNPEQLQTHSTFWHTQGRFVLGMEPAPDRTDGVALESLDSMQFVFYGTNTNSLRIDLSGAPEALPAVAVDTLRDYEEIAIGELRPEMHTWDAPRTSDWAIAVGDFDVAPTIVGPGSGSSGSPGNGGSSGGSGMPGTTASMEDGDTGGGCATAPGSGAPVQTFWIGLLYACASLLRRSSSDRKRCDSSVFDR